MSVKVLNPEYFIWSKKKPTKGKWELVAVHSGNGFENRLWKKRG